MNPFRLILLSFWLALLTPTSLQLAAHGAAHGAAQETLQKEYQEVVKEAAKEAVKEAAPRANQATWLESLEEAQTMSAINGKPVLIKFEAEWCGPCTELSKEFEKPEFSEISDRTILVRIDVDQQPEISQEYGVQSIPMVIIVDSNGDVIGNKVGAAGLDDWIQWHKTTVKGTAFEMPDVLASNDPPTRTETKDLIERLGSRDATMRQLTMERLAAHPGKTRVALIDSLSSAGKLEQKLSVLEVLARWDAPTDGLDPWTDPTFTAQSLVKLNQWKATSLEDLPQVVGELTPALLVEADEEIDRMLAAKNLRRSLPRLTRFGTGLLPTVTERLRNSETDQDIERLRALRYWLAASNELRLGWFGGLIELASSSPTNRRAAVQALMNRASLIDEPLLLELFADPDPLVRELSLKGLQQIGAKETDATLARMLKDPDKNVRAAVLKQFSESEASHMAGAVAEYLKEETDGDLIVHALRFMRTGEGDVAVNAVLPFVKNENWQVRAEVAETLGEIDDDDLSKDVLEARETAVMTLLEDSDGFVVSKAAGSLPREKSKSMLKRLTKIAASNPKIANDIVASMLDSNYYSYGDEKTDLKPYFKELLEHERSEVRVAGATGMVADGDGELTDTELLSLLKDSHAKVRIAGMKGLLETFDELRNSVADNVRSQQVTTQIEIERPTLMGSLMSGLFGSSGKRKKAREKKKEEAAKKAAEEADKLAAKEADKPAQPKLKLPELSTEAWIGRWKAGEIKTTTPKSLALVDELAGSKDADERTMAYMCQATLGDEAALAKLLEMVSEKPDVKDNLHEILKWLPTELRSNTFRKLVETTKSEADFSRLVDAFANVRNPELAKEIWALTENESVPLMSIRSALLELYFGQGVSYYSTIDPEDITADLRTYARKDIETYLDDTPARQKMVLVSIQQFDLKRAKELAETLSTKATDDAIKDLAFRIKLKPHPAEGDRYDRAEPDRAFAVDFLDTDEPWKFSTTLRFLALGEEAIAHGGEDSDRALRLPHESYYSYSSSGESEVKVKIPKPPKGLTLKMLERDELIVDETTEAMVAYFKSLLDAKPDLTPLISHWENGDDEDIAELLYKAIAMQNDDSLTPTLEEIYQLHGEDDNQFSAGLYWTIRSMDGSKVIKLRKKIRDEIGMDNLKNY